jgi:hypothetical protein
MEQDSAGQKRLCVQKKNYRLHRTAKEQHCASETSVCAKQKRMKRNPPVCVCIICDIYMYIYIVCVCVCIICDLYTFISNALQ